jgi:protocatechuate 3,4-dioxygenase, beta subunit
MERAKRLLVWNPQVGGSPSIQRNFQVADLLNSHSSRICSNRSNQANLIRQLSVSSLNQQIRMRKVTLFPFAFAVALSACAQSFDPCEDCELLFEGMPADIPSSARLAPAGEPGESLTLEGTIYKPDGKTPAPGVVLYVYHTDATGRYSPAKDQRNGRRHGHLRGWVKTDANGRYSFSTIRPASYPNSRNPQHIHPIVIESSSRYYWIDDYMFADDPVLTDNEKNRLQGRGGPGVITLTRVSGGWKGKRDIILGRGIPNYKP